MTYHPANTLPVDMATYTKCEITPDWFRLFLPSVGASEGLFWGQFKLLACSKKNINIPAFDEDDIFTAEKYNGMLYSWEIT